MSLTLVEVALNIGGRPVVKGVSLNRIKKCFRTSATITAECRVDLFLKALNNYVKERRVKTSIILLPLEGDPFASFSFWYMANQTKGMLISPSEDWP